MKAVIFDLDGVIIDSEPLYLRINIKTLNHYDIKASEEDFNQFVGMTDVGVFTTLKEKYQFPYTIEEMLAYHSELVWDTFNHLEAEPIEGIRNLLQTLKDHHIPTAVASSSPKKIINVILSKFELDDYFKLIVSGQEVSHGKPAPDIFLETAKRLHVAPADCVVIEDSKNGTIAAKKAGMECIGFQNLNSGNQDLSIADVIVDSIAEINLLNF
ncbi:MAG: family hydrolase [Massilibacillus sp.]|jgi:HAD superfamily hydrolase (TIGR01509 family)|nr:family hydrolase [Massilibacillus sp.]